MFQWRIEISQSNRRTAYTVLKREGRDDFWLNIGLAFQHADGKGLNIVLQALLLDGKIVLRERATGGLRSSGGTTNAVPAASGGRDEP